LDQNLAGCFPRVRAEDCHQKIASTGSHKTGNTENLAAANSKTHAINEHPPAHVRIFDRDVARFEDGLASLVVGLGEDVADFAPNHAGDDLNFVNGVGRLSPNRPSIAKDGNTIGYPQSVV